MRKIFLTITVVLAGALTAFAQDDKDNHNTVEKCDTLTSTSVEKGNVYMSRKMRHADLDKRGKGQCVHEPLPTGNIGLGAI